MKVFFVKMLTKVICRFLIATITFMSTFCVLNASLIVYWNMPTFQCVKYGFRFADLIAANSIKMNHNDNFRGDVISILYDPGFFPAFLEDRRRKLLVRNGGIPQNGDLQAHLNVFRNNVSKLVAHAGLAVIDFESWRPIYRQNFAKLKIYKKLSDDVTWSKFPFAAPQTVRDLSMTSFEHFAIVFMAETIRVAKELRPGAVWGYYGYPYCFNAAEATCPWMVQIENIRLLKLFGHFDAFFPSIYLTDDMPVERHVSVIRARLLEAHRVASLLHKKPQIFPYFSLKYRQNQTRFLEQARYFQIWIPSSNNFLKNNYRFFDELP